MRTGSNTNKTAPATSKEAAPDEEGGSGFLSTLGRACGGVPSLVPEGEEGARICLIPPLAMLPDGEQRRW